MAEIRPNTRTNYNQACHIHARNSLSRHAGLPLSKSCLKNTKIQASVLFLLILHAIGSLVKEDFGLSAAIFLFAGTMTPTFIQANAHPHSQLGHRQ